MGIESRLQHLEKQAERQSRGTARIVLLHQQPDGRFREEGSGKLYTEEEWERQAESEGWPLTIRVVRE